MELRNNLPSGRPKKDYDDVDEAMFQGVEGPCELILCIPRIEKSDFHEFAYVSF
jgi:hypothetical protein